MIPERMAELLAVRAWAGLSPDEDGELEELLIQHPEVDARDFDLAIEALQLEPLPASLRARLLDQATREWPQTSTWGTWGRASWWVGAVLVAALLALATGELPRIFGLIEGR